MLPPSHDAFGGRPRRLRVLLATLLLGLAATGATVAYATTWARDLPKTLAFANVHEPFGERSMLDPENARAGVQRLLERVPADARIDRLYLRAGEIGARALTPGQRESWRVTTTITGDVQSAFRRPWEPAEGAPRAAVAALDMAVPVRAAAARWRATGATSAGPLVSLEIDDGRPRGWRIVFPGNGAAADRTVIVDLDGGPRR